jgi:thioesterase domain-containing protein
MARQLRLAGEDVSFLGLIDTYSRTNLGRKGDGSGSGFSDNFLPALVMQYDPAADKALIADIRSTAGNDPRLFFDEAKRHGLIPPSLGFEEANTHYRFTLALMRIAAEYVPPPIDVQVTLFAAEESLAVAPTLRWSEEVMRGWRMHVVGGNHVSIMRPPNIQPLADKMANELGRPHAPRSQSRAVSL